MEARLRRDNAIRRHPSGHSVRVLRATSAAERRGGVTPFNAPVVPNTYRQDSAGAYGHGAGTPVDIARQRISAEQAKLAAQPGGLIA